MAATFMLEVARVDPDRTSVTYKITSLDGVRRMAVSRAFVLRTLAWSRRGDYAIFRALKELLAAVSLNGQGAVLDDPRTLDRFIVRTRVTAIENYVDWENIDHAGALAKMIVALKLPTSYHLEVVLREPGHLARIKVGDVLKSEQADRWISPEPGSLYEFKRDDEHWRLHRFLAAYNEGGADVIAWTNAHDSVLSRTNGLLPWQEGSRWGAVDADGATVVPVVYEDVDHQGGLVFKAGGRWIPVAELLAAERPAPVSAFSDPARVVESRAELDVGLIGQRSVDAAAVTRASAGIREAQVERYGLTIAGLLRCWIRVFARRPDIVVVHDAVGDAVPAETLAGLARRVPAHVHAFAAELGSVRFCWVFKDMSAEVGRYDEGYNGGRVNVVDVAELRWSAAESGGFIARFDELQAEGSTFLEHAAGTAPDTAELVFVSRGQRYDYGAVEGYVTRGAASAFVWYWAKTGEREGAEFLARLAAASWPRSTPAEEVVAGLCAAGLAEAEALAVQRWLGADAVLLLPV